jgi:hypothetical protein
MRKMLILAMVLVSINISSAQIQPAPMELWPKGAPNALGKEPQDIPTIRFDEAEVGTSS